jgi:ribosomal protein S18 acetylase RimI-like enzyme
MRVVRYATPAEFLDAHQTALLVRECENSLKLGLSLRLAEGQESADSARFYGIEDRDGKPVGQAIQTSAQRPLVLSHLTAEAAACLFKRLKDDGFSGSELRGPGETTTPFADAWAKATNQAARLTMEHYLYEARSVAVPPNEGGELAVAEKTDHGLALEWVKNFSRECNLHQPEDTHLLEEVVSRLISGGLLFFWRAESGQFVSMASRNRESPNGATVSFVYTPEGLRRRGYAGRITGHLSQRILDSGRSFGALYTDASNPTSNAIYRQLGYEVIGEGVEYTFVPRDASAATASQ